MYAEMAARLTVRQHAERAHSLVAPYEDQAVTTGAAITFVGAVPHYLGLTAAALDQRPRARAHFERALTMHERLGARPWALRTRYELASLMLQEPEHRNQGLRALEEVAEAAAALSSSRLGTISAALPSRTASAIKRSCGSVRKPVR